MMESLSLKSSEIELDDTEVERMPEIVFQLLADKLTYDWPRVARLLSFSESEIESLYEDFSTTYERTFQMLSKWRRANPNKQWCQLSEILYGVGRKDLAIECERNLIPRYSTFGVQGPSATFFAREDELLKIHRCLSEFESIKSKKAFLVVTGMTGIGKTQLVRKYTENYRKHYHNFVWLDAAHGKLNTSLITLCHKLGINTKESYDVCLSTEIIISKVHNYFKKDKTLYIYDNVDDESVKNFEKYLSNLPNSFTLVTSQWKCWSPEAIIIQIEPFSPQDAFLFLKKYINTEDDEKLREITEIKSYHPLALYQAILYINNTRVSLQEYLDLYKSYPVDVLEEFIHTETEAKSAIASINMILMKLETNKELLSLEILYCLSYCDGKHITKAFVKQFSLYLKQNDPFKINHAITVLTNFSLLNSSTPENFHLENLSMHDITQLACQYFQKQKEISMDYIKKLISFMKEKLNSVKDHYEYGLDWYKHFLHMFWNNKKEVASEFADYTEEIFCLLQNKGLFEEILAILEEVTNFQKSENGKNHPSTIDTIHLKAKCIYSMGKYKEAFLVYIKVEKLRLKSLGKNHPLTLDVKHDKALCMDSMGKYEGAFQVYSKVEKHYIEMFGIDHPTTLQTKHNKANCLINMGKYTKAYQVYTEVEKLKVALLGCNHRSTLDTKQNMALCMDKMGKYEKAFQTYCEVEKLQSNFFGNSHPSTLLTKHNKANCMINMGKYEEAFQAYCEIEKLKVVVLGKNHPSTLDTKHNIALCMEKLNKFKEAFHIFTEVEKLRVKILGNNHPSTLDTKYRVAFCMDSMGKHEEANEAYSEVKQLRAAMLQTNHYSGLKRILCCYRCCIPEKNGLEVNSA